jgi:hypothetical protein
MSLGCSGHRPSDVILSEAKDLGGGRRRFTFRIGLISLLALVLPSAALVAQQRGVVEYRRALTEIQAALRAGETARARQAAAALRGASFSFDGDRFTADGALLERVRGARSPAEVRGAAAAVGRVVAALDAVAGRPAAGTGESDRLLFVRLARAQAADVIAPGGEVPELSFEEPSFWRAVRAAIERATARLEELLDRLIRRLGDRLRDLFRERRRGEARLDTRAVTWLVMALAVLLAVLAFLLFRRRGPAQPRAALPPPAFDPAADADPLSRRESEWARFAGELAAAGRYREAIRARYHAVLVALYGGGWLHYRKGRTNWEYVAALAPALPWRGDFIRLTRTFEEEWYGRRESREEAYARASDEAERVVSALDREVAA